MLQNLRCNFSEGMFKGKFKVWWNECTWATKLYVNLFCFLK